MPRGPPTLCGATVRVAACRSRIGLASQATAWVWSTWSAIRSSVARAASGTSRMPVWPHAVVMQTTAGGPDAGSIAHSAAVAAVVLPSAASCSPTPRHPRRTRS